jgi:hypothetical protein
VATAPPKLPNPPGGTRPASRRGIEPVFGDDLDDEDDWPNPAERDHYFDSYLDEDDDEEEDSESVLEILARLAVDVEAGRAELRPGWKLDRPRPGVLVWTLPSGGRLASTVTGEPLPVPKSRLSSDPGQPA